MFGPRSTMSQLYEQLVQSVLELMDEKRSLEEKISRIVRNGTA